MAQRRFDQPVYRRASNAIAAPKQRATASIAIFLLVTDCNTRIWEVAPPHRGLSFLARMVFREDTRSSRVPAMTN